MNTLSFKYSLRLQNTNVRKLRNYLLESLKQILLLLLLLLCYDLRLQKYTSYIIGR